MARLLQVVGFRLRNELIVDRMSKAVDADADVDAGWSIKAVKTDMFGPSTVGCSVAMRW